MLQGYKWLLTGHPRSSPFNNQSDLKKTYIKLLPSFKASKRNTKLNTEHTGTRLKSSHNPNEKIQISFYLLAMILLSSFFFLFHMPHNFALQTRHTGSIVVLSTPYPPPPQLDITSSTLRTYCLLCREHLEFCIIGSRSWLISQPTVTFLERHSRISFVMLILVQKANIFIIWAFALVNSGCHNKVPYSGWFKQQKLFSQFWRLEGWDQGGSRSGSRDSLHLACRGCLPAVSSRGWERVLESPSLRHQFWWIRALYLWPHLTLITFLNTPSLI